MACAQLVVEAHAKVLVAVGEATATLAVVIATAAALHALDARWTRPAGGTVAYTPPTAVFSAKSDGTRNTLHADALVAEVANRYEIAKRHVHGDLAGEPLVGGIVSY